MVTLVVLHIKYGAFKGYSKMAKNLPSLFLFGPATLNLPPLVHLFTLN